MRFYADVKESQEREREREKDLGEGGGERARETNLGKRRHITQDIIHLLA